MSCMKYMLSKCLLKGLSDDTAQFEEFTCTPRNYGCPTQQPLVEFSILFHLK